MDRTAMAWVTAVLLVTALTTLPEGVRALTCVDVGIDLLPCLDYIKSGGVVPSGCCGGLIKLVNDAKTTVDRRTACNCLKSLAKGASNDELSRAAALPDKCNVSIPYKIDPSTDCSKIN